MDCREEKKEEDLICLTRPRRFVTFYISALEILLLTYLLTLPYLGFLVSRCSDIHVAD